jgi:acetolactate synthase I/II/III large subunit
LKIMGVTRVFSVPGESFLAVLDGLYDSGIENIVCRHEGGATMMAEAYGKMTGRPGIVFVTRGPGATNAAAGIHIARQDSTPLIMFVGQIETGHRDREAFQEISYAQVFGGLAKWASEVDQTERLPEYVSRAFRVALSGRPGPVVLALPEDMLSRRAEAMDIRPPAPDPRPDWQAAAGAVMDRLAQAQRPLVIVGGPHWSVEAAGSLARLAEVQRLPVAAGFRRQDYIDNRHPSYAGDLNVAVNPRLAQRFRDADALLILGSRLGDIETQGYTLMDPGPSVKTIIHIHPDPDEPGRVWQPSLSVTARADDFTHALARLSPVGAGWADWTAAAHADYLGWIALRETPGAVKLEQVVRWLSDNLPPDAILTNGAGNYAAFLHRYHVFKQFRTQLAPTSGSMGYGFPAAISAALEHRDRPVICMAGDGCFQMTLNEMSTAIQHGAAPIVVVANNGRYGTIRMHQERTYPGRVSGTDMANPDFAALARAYGGHGERVDRTEDFPAAFARARAAGRLAVIELALDPEALATGQNLTEARAQGVARLQVAT